MRKKRSLKKRRTDSPPPRLSRSDRIDSILAAALPLFARDGYHGVTSRELARAAGVSEALLFKYFPTKKEVQRQLYGYCTRSFELDDEKIARLEPSTPNLVRLMYYLNRIAFVRRQAGSGTVSRLILQSLLGDGVFARLILQGESLIAMEAKAISCMQVGIRRGEITAEGPALVDRFWFARGAAFIAGVHRLPPKPIRTYRGEPLEIAREATVFSLRGIGLTAGALMLYAAPATFVAWERDETVSLLEPVGRQD